MKRLIFCLGIAAGLVPVANGQNFPTSSTFRIEMGPGQINPLVGGSSPSWYIEDYIGSLTVPGDVEFVSPLGNRFFNYRHHGGSGPTNPIYSGKFFFDGVSDIGIDSGIVMGSGRIVYCGGAAGAGPGIWSGIPHAAAYQSSGPNQPTYATNCHAEHPVFYTSRDTQYADLVALNNGDSIWDANVLDFDFVPKGNMIRLDYVFASEEFTRVDCDGPTDVMGIFLSGPGITGQQNIAVLPGTNTPVNPHTVWPANSPCYPESPAASPYYVDNTNGQNIIYDGFTTVLTAAAYVNPCDTYHLKVAVADGALHPYDTTFRLSYANNPNTGPFDSLPNVYFGTIHGRMLYDSGLFLKFGSFRSTDSLWLEALGGTSLSGEHPYAVRGCLDGKIRVHSATAWPLDRELELVLGGDAVAGTDFQLFNTSVVIPADEKFVDIDVLALTNGSGTKTLQAVLKSPYGACSGLGDYLDTATMIISDGYYVDAQPGDTTICSGCSVQLRVQGEDFLDYSWTPATGLDDPNSKEPVARPAGTTEYIVTASPPAGYPCEGGSSSVSINIDPTGIEGVGSNAVLQVAPNPFTSGFRLTLAGAQQHTVFDIAIYNLPGQRVYQTKGTIATINQSLSRVGEQWPPGAYYMELRSKAEGLMYRQKLVKH